MLSRKFMVVAAVGTAIGMTAFAGMAEEKIQGKVVRTKLTACQPRANGGGCEGTLTLETNVGGKAQQTPIKVTADTIIKRGKDFIFLPATQGSTVAVDYKVEKGEKAATMIDVVSAR
jgi:hypothetical protein